MSIQRDPHGGNIRNILDRLYSLERQAVLAHSSIGRDGLEVYDGGWIKILNGGLEVIGSAFITGRLVSTGENIFNGITEINGPTTLAGDFEIVEGGIFRAGESSINPDGSAVFGTLDIEPDGTLTVRNDVNIEAGGKLKAGALEIEPANGGQINFTGGSLSASANFGALLNNNTAVVLQAPVVELKSSTVSMAAIPIKPAAQLTAIGIDANGTVHRIQE